MLSSSDIPVVEVARELSRLGLEAGFLVPTPTGLSKSILDATGPLRDYLRRQDAHDYEAQAQGTAHKKILPCYFVELNGLTDSRASLYRPETKTGDPRIWFSGLPAYAQPGNLLIVLARDRTLYVINASRHDIWGSRTDAYSQLSQLLYDFQKQAGGLANELLIRLKAITQKGFIRSIRSGDTGVGATLENELGIETNSSPAPDYKERIEIKASRGRKKGSTNRSTLYSQVPDWGASRCKDGTEIVERYGYVRSGRKELYCTVRERPNPQGLYFEVDEGSGLLRCLARVANEVEDVCVWRLAKLQERLGSKHAETFWVRAESGKDATGAETFHYVEVLHTKAPIISALVPMLAAGKVTMDFLLHLKPSGKARDHGYLFKVHPDDFTVLFPPSQRHDLLVDPPERRGIYEA
jgi:hypothetical protein